MTDDPKTDDPDKIATWLIQQHGTKGAYFAAIDGAAQALNDGDGYRLSIWRDVKRTLTERAKLGNPTEPDPIGASDPPA